MKTKRIIFFLMFPGAIGAQTLDRQVLANAGMYSVDAGSGMSFSSTIGETMVRLEEAPSFAMTQGFQQPDLEIITGITNPTIAGFNASAWPNPFEDHINLLISQVKGSDLIVSFSDMAGRKILADQTISAGEGSSNWTITPAGFAAGVYLIKIQTQNGDCSTVLRVTKSH